MMMMPNDTRSAWLALADGETFRGHAIGADGYTVGEVVFNTAMTGYQEILTDPSYACQIVTLTYPHIGNVGVNQEDVEAAKVHAAGLIIRDLPVMSSNFRQQQPLSDYLRDQGIVALAGIDTRRLTRILRDKGAQNGCVIVGDSNATQAVELARAFPSLAKMDLAKAVSVEKPYQWTQTEWQLGQGYQHQSQATYRVVAFDYGVKFNSLRMLAQRGCQLTVLPADANVDDALAVKPDGVFLSNGPGDPQPCAYAIRTTRQLIDTGLPMFGICFGHQLMGLAIGAKTIKMKNGHHGANHPVKDLDSGRVMITSQNHGFVVDADSLPTNARITHISLFDHTLQGFELTDRPAFCFQGHPEASPGPHDLAYLFDRFITLMNRKCRSAQTLNVS